MVYAGRRHIHLPGRLPRKALDRWWGAANSWMCRRCQHLSSDPVCFPFVDIARLVNLEFGLQTQSLLLAALAAFPTWRRIPAGALALQYPALAGAQRHRRG